MISLGSSKKGPNDSTLQARPGALHGALNDPMQPRPHTGPKKAAIPLAGKLETLSDSSPEGTQHSLRCGRCQEGESPGSPQAQQSAQHTPPRRPNHKEAPNSSHQVPASGVERTARRLPSPLDSGPPSLERTLELCMRPAGQTAIVRKRKRWRCCRPPAAPALEPSHALSRPAHRPKTVGGCR